MAPIATHLTTARATVGSMSYHVQDLHEQLGQLYLILSRPLTEENRTQGLHIANQVMADLRSLSERSDYLKLSIRGIESDINAGVESLRKLLMGPNTLYNREESLKGSADTMPADPYEL